MDYLSEAVIHMKFGKPSTAEPWTVILLVKTFCSPSNRLCFTAVVANVCRFDFELTVMLGAFLLTKKHTYVCM